MADSLFDQNDNDDQDYLAELTKPGAKFDRSKFQSDKDLMQAMAKSNAHGDRFIAHKNQEFDELRTEYTKVSTIANALPKLDDLVARLENRGSGNDSTANNLADNGPPSLDPNQVKDLVAKQLTEMKAQEREDANMVKVENFFRQNYGDSAAKMLREKMNTYNLSQEDLRYIAMKSPEAALNALGVNQQRETSFQELPRSSQRTDNFSTTPEIRDAVYYEKMRSEKSKEYFSPQVSLQRLKDMEHPDFLTRYRQIEAMKKR